MPVLILNRQSRLPEDGWHQIEALGEHINHEAKVVQVIDAPAVESIVNRFRQEAAAENFGGVLVDRDHFSLDPDHTSEAMGWAMELRNQGGIPEAKVNWTAQGRPLIESQPNQPPSFKYFSTVYDPKECEVLGSRKVGKDTYKVVRPLRLDRLALTNDPNNKGAKPISNRHPAATAERSENPTTMKSVFKALGLADDASEESAVAALSKIQNRASQADALEIENKKLLESQVEADLDRYAPVITNREKAKETLLKNRAGAIEFFDGLVESSKKATPAVPAKAAAPDRPSRITNRETAATPAAEAEKVAQREVRAQRIRNRATAMSREEKIPFHAAFAACEREEPIVP